MGQPLAKQGDTVVGVDSHIYLIPAAAGAPVPTPLPSAFNGILQLKLSTDVFVMGMPAATVGSIAVNTPPHIPQGGPFQRPPSNQGEIIMGSATVKINGKAAARAGDTARTCNDPADAPMGTVVSVGTVLVG